MDEDTHVAAHCRSRVFPWTLPDVIISGHFSNFRAYIPFTVKRYSLMKTILYMLLSLFLLPSFLEAQLNPITARELAGTAGTRAKNEWANDAYLQNVLFAGGTQSGITLVIDPLTGKANAWVYGFYSPSKDSMKYYIGVSVIIIGPQIVEAPASVGIPALPVGGHLELKEPFIDSPEALQAARNAGADVFLQNHPTAIVDIAAALNNPEDIPTVPKGKYWLFRFNDAVDQYFCYVNAETGVPAQCGTISGEGALPTPAAFRLGPLYPQPVHSASPAVVSYELANVQPIRLTVIDLLGREHSLIDQGQRASGEHRVHLAAGTFRTPGVYFLRLVTPAGTALQKVIVAE